MRGFERGSLADGQADLSDPAREAHASPGAPRAQAAGDGDRLRPGSAGDPGGTDDGGATPLPIATPQPRTNALATVAIACAILCPIGPGALLAIAFAFIALGQIRRSGGSLVGAGRAKVAIVLSCAELVAVGHAIHRTGNLARQSALAEAEAQQFFHDFTRYQEDEHFGEKARSRMSQGLRLALIPPADAHLSFEIADALGAFQSFQSCPNFFVHLPQGTTPKVAELSCTSTFAPDGPPIATEVRLVPEGERWRIAGFSLKSPLLPRALSAQGPIFATVQLQDFKPKR